MLSRCVAGDNDAVNHDDIYHDGINRDVGIGRDNSDSNDVDVDDSERECDNNDSDDNN